MAMTMPMSELKRYRCPLNGLSCVGNCMLAGVEPEKKDGEAQFFCLVAKASQSICEATKNYIK